MLFLKRWAENREQAMRGKVLTHLRGLPQWQLDAAGISPVLLASGVDAWPWRSPELQEPEMRSKVVKEIFDYAPQPAANTSNTIASTAQELDSAA